MTRKPGGDSSLQRLKPDFVGDFLSELKRLCENGKIRTSAAKADLILHALRRG